MRGLSPSPKPFGSFSQFGAILELLNPAYDSGRPPRTIPHYVVTKPQTRRTTPLHVRARKALEAELRGEGEETSTLQLDSLRKHVNMYKEKPLSPGHYHPRPDYLLPKAANASIARASSLPMIGDVYCVKANQRENGCTGHRQGKLSPLQRSQGADWARESTRGPLFDTSLGATEGRFAAEPGSTMRRNRGVRFERMGMRGELWRPNEHLPDYVPKYEVVSRYPLR